MFILIVAISNLQLRIKDYVNTNKNVAYNGLTQ